MKVWSKSSSASKKHWKRDLSLMFFSRTDL